MDEIFSNRSVSESNDSETSLENSCDSLLSGMFNGSKMMSLKSSPSKRRAKQKRVISVPMKDVEGSKLNKGEIRQPTCDTWAWRKYGQKPIKGSPYPRGYYRCSSSKGCPARKQVERSRTDPNMLLLTYSYEHNHNWPASKNNAISTTITVTKEKEPSQSDQQFGASFGQSLSINEFGWFESTSSSLLESPILTESSVTDTDMLAIFSMREEDHDSLFADLGELPEFSSVFSSKMMERNGELA